MSDADRRTHLRYRDPESTTLHFLIKDGERERPVTGLVVNESHRGLACVYVGPALPVNTAIVWQETASIGTCCTVLRCEELYTDVFLLALRIDD
jgi:hypothetical protein